MKTERSYICIDLKSFYASVECRERGLDPLTTNLVVADESRTDKTICLAVTPALKERGVPGRPRLFEVKRKVRELNCGRNGPATSCDKTVLDRHRNIRIDFIIAPPRMALYMNYSVRIYQVYLRYIAPEDIHVYSIDEVFMDVTDYLRTYRMTAHELALKIIKDVLKETGITATVGLGTNMYLAKVAMDILAKKAAPDRDGARIAALTESSYREKLWGHRPITDFWRVGHGYERKLKSVGITTMGEIARCSIGKPGDYYNEDLLYKLFGVNAELLIDHAWGWEPCTIQDVKSYKPSSNSLSSGQVLHEPYSPDKARVIVIEMADSLAMDLTRKGVAADQIVMTIGYDVSSIKPGFKGSIHVYLDWYGRPVPVHAHGTYNLQYFTASSAEITRAAATLYDRIINPEFMIRRVNICVTHVRKAPEENFVQMDLFTDYAALEREKKRKERELRLQEAVLDIKARYGKNAVLKGTNLLEGATMRERNEQIGGHKA